MCAKKWVGKSGTALRDSGFVNCYDMCGKYIIALQYILNNSQKLAGEKCKAAAQI